MASSAAVDQIILVGQTLTIYKRFITGVNVLWFYDYFLTLSDEIRYAWSRKFSLVFVLFLINRYFPLWYILWMFVASSSPNYTKSQCDRTGWFSAFYFSSVTLFAQLAITLRVYAVTRNNRIVVSYLSFITFVQAVFGAYLAIYFSSRPATVFPDVPLEEYQFCIFQRWRTGEVVVTSLTLLYDTSAFLIIIYSARNRRNMNFTGVPNLLDNIVQGASMYFLVIFTGHLLLVLFELFAPQAIQLLPASGNGILMPLMVVRLMLSLKKTADTGSMWGFTTNGQPPPMRFAPNATPGGLECIDMSVLPERTDFVRE